MGAKQAFIRKFWYMLGGGKSLHRGVWVYVGRGTELVFTRELGYMLGGGKSKSSLGSFGICWEGEEQAFTREFGFMLGGGGGASLHWEVWVYVRSAAKQAFTGEFWYMLGREQAFTMEFGYMLGGGQSKPSLGSLGICWEGGGASHH